MQPALTCIHTGLPNNSIPSSQDPDFTTSPCQQAQREGTAGKAKQHSRVWVWPTSPKSWHSSAQDTQGGVPGDKSWLDIPWSPLFLFH